MKIHFLMASEGAVVDRATNRISIFNVIDDLQSPSFPTFLPYLSISSLVTRDAGEEVPSTKLQVSLNEKMLMEGDLPMEFQEHLRARGVVTIQGLVLPEPGELNIRILFGGEVAGTWIIPVRNIGDAQTAPPTDTGTVAVAQPG